MGEELELLWTAVAWLGVLTALGSAPALLLVPQRALLLAPILGLAIGAAASATAALVFAMSTAAWVVLLPLALISLFGAVALRKNRSSASGFRELAPPIGIALIGLAVALVPGIAKQSNGPLVYAIADVWLHVTRGLWLAGHSVLDGASVDALAERLPEWAGAQNLEPDQRLGTPALNAAFSELLNAGPDKTYYPLSAVAFALIPLAIWVTARELGVGRLAAAIGSAYGISAGTLTMVVDGAAENLGGLAYAPLVCLFTLRAVQQFSAKPVLLAGILWAGLVTVYPENIPPIVLAAAGLLAWWVLRGAARRAPWREYVRPVVALGGVALVALVVAPYSFIRGVGYYVWLSEVSTGGSAVRHLTPADTGAWAFGVLHLYQLQNFDLLSPLKTMIAMAVPLALLGVVAYGLVRFPRPAAAVIVLPATASGFLAVYLYWYVHDHEYALWKWLALMLPFLAVGIAMGFDALGIGRRNGRRTILAAIVATAGLGTVAYGDIEFTRLLVDRVAFVSSDARQVAGAVSRADRPHTVFLEGPEAMRYPLADYIGLYVAQSTAEDARVSFDAGAEGAGAQGSQLLRPLPPWERYERPTYRYVLSTFGGLVTGRRVLSRRGRFALLERAPVDVVPIGIGSWTKRYGQVVPYATSPFQLWISASRNGKAHLRLRSEPQNAVQLVQGRTELPKGPCATVFLRRGWTRLDATPVVRAPTAPLAGTWETDADRVEGILPPPALPGVAVVGVTAGWGGC